MNKIKVLSREVANIIAAGEVVDNPASLIKELIENSLDAKATTIRIELSNECRNISVKDNGLGMSLDDLELSIKRHATSKIEVKEDLFNLSTYGFRGEALASISAVSQMSIASNNGENGHRILVDAGEIVGQDIYPMNRGTDVVVENLFFNVPARLKFLRSSNNEYNKAKSIVLKEALANPEVAFNLVIEGTSKLSCSGNGIENTIIELFNVNTLKALNKFELGFLGDATLYRSSKDNIFTYFNGRYAKSHIVDKAILDSYYTRLDKGKYPFVILSLTIDPGSMDVNVHPSKKIIKFTNERLIYSLVRNKVSTSLDLIDRNLVTAAVTSDKIVDISRVKIKPESKDVRRDVEESIDSSLEQKRGKEHSIDNNVVDNIDNSTINNNTIDNNTYAKEKLNDLSAVKSTNLLDSLNFVREEKKIANRKIEESRSDNYFDKNRFLGQIYNSFSLVECEDRVEIYDNHIVQERILYEEIKDRYYNKKILSQPLLVPIRVHLNKLEKDLVLESLDFFSEYGFEVEDFGGSEVVLRKVPQFNFKDSLKNIFIDLVDLLGSNKIKDSIRDIREEVIITMSCRKSIKAGDRVDDSEMKLLINKLHKLGKYTCPHGRNIIIDLTLKYINKQFHRA